MMMRKTIFLGCIKYAEYNDDILTSVCGPTEGLRIILKHAHAAFEQRAE